MYIAIDFGGTNIRVLGITDLDNISFSSLDIFPTQNNYQADLDSIIKSITTITPSPSAISIGIAGGVTQASGMLTSTHALTDWVDKPLVSVLTKQFDCPVFLKNDGVMGGLGEAYFGVTKGKEFLYITWGTGVGSCLIGFKDGELEAHRPTDRSLIHELETHIGGRAGKIKYGKPLSELDSDQWQEVTSMLQEYLIKFSNSKMWEHSKRFVFGGGISQKQSERILSMNLPDGYSISLSDLGDKSGLYGAIAVMRNNL